MKLSTSLLIILIPWWQRQKFQTGVRYKFLFLRCSMPKWSMVLNYLMISKNYINRIKSPESLLLSFSFRFFRKPFRMYFVGWHPKPIFVKQFQPFGMLPCRCSTTPQKNKAECWHFKAFPIKLICLVSEIFSPPHWAFRIITLIRFW